MQIIWSDFSAEMLAEVYFYYKKTAGITIAKRIKSNIFKATNQLLKFPESRQEEEILKYLGEGHRYLVEGNYKIVYKPVKEGILITDLFDTRQEPAKINDKDRKPSSN